MAGCGPTFRPTGYLESYEGLTFAGGNSDLAWESMPGTFVPPDGIYLAPVQTRAGVTKNADLRIELEDLLRQRIYVWLNTKYDKKLQGSSREPNLVNYALVGKTACELELAITEVRTGLGLARWLLGFYLGATTFQVEGRLRALPERTVIARFVCRVVHSGDSYGGLNPRSLSSRYCLRVSADWAGRDIADLPSLLWERWREVADAVENAEDEEAPTPEAGEAPATPDTARAAAVEVAASN